MFVLFLLKQAFIICLIFFFETRLYYSCLVFAKIRNYVRFIEGELSRFVFLCKISLKQTENQTGLKWTGLVWG